MNNKDFDKVFQEKLEHFEIEPPSGTWEKITDGLERKSPVQVFKKKVWLGVAASILLMAGIWIWLRPVGPPRVVTGQEQEVAEHKGQWGTVDDNSNENKPDLKNTTHGESALPPSFTAKSMVEARHSKMDESHIPVHNKRDGKDGSAPLLAALPASAADSGLVIMHKTDRYHPQVVEQHVAEQSLARADVEPRPFQGTEEYNRARTASGDRNLSTGKVINAVIGIFDKRADKVVSFASSEGESKLEKVSIGRVVISI